MAPGEIVPEELTGLDELEPGHLAAVLELVTAAQPETAEVGRAPPARRPATPPPDMVDLLHKLGDLRDGGRPHRRGVRRQEGRAAATHLSARAA